MCQINCIFCKTVFEVELWEVEPCPGCGAEYDWEDDPYIRWEFPNGL